MWTVIKSYSDMNIQQDESIHLGKKIFEDFCRIFESIDTIHGIEIVPSIEDENVSPVMHEQGNIGIKPWCVPLIFTYAYKRLTEMRGLSSEEVNKLSRCVVICCADCTTAWNQRKRIFLENQPSRSKLEEELDLCRLVHSIHPKSCETFAQRRWILCKILAMVLPTPDASCDDCKCKNYTDAAMKEWFDVVQQELNACKLAGELQQSNYNAWSHKSWVIQNCLVNLLKRFADCRQSAANNCSGLSIHEKIGKFLTADVEAMLLYSEKHISDISVLSSLAFTLHHCTVINLSNKNVTKTPNNPDLQVEERFQEMTSLWLSLLHHNNRMLGLYDDGHEALWVHRRNLFLFYRKSALYDITCGEKLLGDDSEVLRNEFTIEKERKLCTNKDLKQKKFAQRHLLFIEKFIT